MTIKGQLNEVFRGRKKSGNDPDNQSVYCEVQTALPGRVTAAQRGSLILLMQSFFQDPCLIYVTNLASEIED